MSDSVAGSFLRIRSGVREFALSAAIVHEVAELALLTPLPGVGSAVLGVANVRGAILTVVELGQLIGDGKPGSPTTLVIVDVGGRRAGLAVDEVVAFGDAESAEVVEVGPLLARVFMG